MRRIGCILAALGLVLVGCEGGGHEASPGRTTPTGPQVAPKGGTGVVKLRVTLAPWRVGVGKPMAVESIDRVTAYVYDASGASVAQQELTVSAQRATGRLVVGAADNLRVVLAYRDGETVRYVGEDADVDVAAGDSTVAEIVEYYMGTSVSSPDSVLVGTEYTVRWQSRPLVEGYELEEARAPDFSDGSQVYAGADTSSVVSAKAEVDTFYYRARVQTAYGYGPWHSTGSASTGTMAVSGTIIIDVPVPPDEPLSERTFELPNGASMEFVWIEPGTFTMGSPSSEPGRDSDEGPQHEVTISAGFWLGKYEITQGQWEAVMGSTPWSGQSNVQSNASHPAVHISWTDIAGSGGLIDQLNSAAGSAVYRLPTEAEWEYACRAGTSTRWSLGDDESQLGDYAWYDANAWNAGLQYAQPVGTKLGNPWGLFDMHGNVFEWVKDWYGSYSSGAQVDPEGPSSGSYRAIRGGVFYRNAQYARSANRSNGPASYRNYNIGARLLRTR